MFKSLYLYLQKTRTPFRGVITISDYLAVAKLFVEVAQHNQVRRGSGHHSRTTYIAKNPEFKKLQKTKKIQKYKNVCLMVREQSKFSPADFCTTFCAEQAEL